MKDKYSFVSPLFGNVKIDYVHDFVHGFINIIKIEGRERIEIQPRSTCCYLISTYNRLKFKISWRRFLSKLQHSHDINFKRRLFTLVGELKQRDKISEQEALQRYYNRPPWTGVALPIIINKPMTLVQAVWKLFFSKNYNKNHGKVFPKLDADQFVTVQPMDAPTDLKFELSFQKTGLLAGLYGSEKQNMNTLLEQQAKEIIAEHESSREAFLKRRSNIYM